METKMKNILEVSNFGKSEMLDRVLFQVNVNELSLNELKDWLLSEKRRFEQKEQFLVTLSKPNTWANGEQNGQ
tara:strand:- start:187 stop:405 length:219 start_codon:yes stop_codon:yes gene_type:complete